MIEQAIQDFNMHKQFSTFMTIMQLLQVWQCKEKESLDNHLLLDSTLYRFKKRNY